MAFTNSLVVQTVYGNKRVLLYNMSPDSAEGTLATPLGNIDFAEVSIKSINSYVTMPRFAENRGTTGTVVAGTIGFSSVVAGGGYVYRVRVEGT